MIDAKELRIGNYLTGFLTRDLVEVDWLVFKHIQDSGNIQAAPYDMSPVYEPIPLTEEWLIKLGLEKTFSDDHYCVFEKDYMKLFFVPSEGDIGFNLLVDFPDTIRTTFAYSVHKLQNVWYLFMGYELTINESNG